MEIYILKITRYTEHKQAMKLLLHHDCWAGTICGVFEDRNTALYYTRKWNRENLNLENRLYFTVQKETIRKFKI